MLLVFLPLVYRSVANCSVTFLVDVPVISSVNISNWQSFFLSLLMLIVHWQIFSHCLASLRCVDETILRLSDDVTFAAMYVR